MPTIRSYYYHWELYKAVQRLYRKNPKALRIARECLVQRIEASYRPNGYPKSNTGKQYYTAIQSWLKANTYD